MPGEPYSIDDLVEDVTVSGFYNCYLVRRRVIRTKVGYHHQPLQKGIGDAVGQLAVIVCLGAMLGKLIAKTGAAQKIAETLVAGFGVRRIQWALVCTGFIAGTTLFYGTGFVLLTPLIFAVVFRYNVPAVYIGLPTLAALSVTHGYLPPHPAPTALVAQLGATVGTTLLYWLAVAIPAILVAGPLFAQTTKNIKTLPQETFRPTPMDPEELPRAFESFLMALLPVILLLVAVPLSGLNLSHEGWTSILAWASNPTVVMLVGLLAATYFLGIRQNKDIGTIMRWYEESIKDVSLILFIIGGAGALKQIFVEAGVDQIIAGSLQYLPVSPLVMGWLIAAVLRIAIGSSTIASLMTAGIMQPLMLQAGTNPDLLVLAIGAGSLICSHINDSGFWLFKEYFTLTLKQTFLTFTLMETIVAVMGLLGVLVLNELIN